MDDHLRVSDAHRDRAVAVLRTHFAAGRLTAAELDERLTAALTAKTFGDLRPVLADLPDAPETLHQARSWPEPAGSLARGYRRRLACYPAWYRRIHEDEILAVLMTDVPPGKRRPGIAESADLLLGALRIRCQPSRAGAEPAWRDALAVLSVIMPLIVLLTTAAAVTRVLTISPPPGQTETTYWNVPALAVPLVLAALVPLALRRRRLAAVGATGLLIAATLAALQPVPGLAGPRSQIAALVMTGAYSFLALGMEILALTASPGPRRGLQILTGKHWAFAVVATLLAFPYTTPISMPVRFAVIAVLCAAMALASSLGRWLLAFLAVFAYPVFARLFIAAAYLRPSAANLAALYLPSVAMAVLAIAAARRHRSARAGQ